MNTNDIELPPNPITPMFAELIDKASGKGTADTVWRLMQEFAIQAIQADRKRRGESSGYAYRYRHYDGGTVVRFNDGREVNGSRPIEVLPYWFAPQPAEPSGAPTHHNAASGAQNGDQAPHPAEPVKTLEVNE